MTKKSRQEKQKHDDRACAKERQEEKRAQAEVGAALARLETDCSRTWPECPKASILCDCRLRAIHAVNGVKRVLKNG